MSDPRTEGRGDELGGASNPSQLKDVNYPSLKEGVSFSLDDTSGTLEMEFPLNDLWVHQNGLHDEDYHPSGPFGGSFF